MEFVPALALLALVKKIVDFAKELLPNSIENKVVQIIAWVAGVAAVMLYAQTAWAEGITVGDVSLADINAASQVAVGFAVGSAAGLANDLIERRNPDAAPDGE